MQPTKNSHTDFENEVLATELDNTDLVENARALMDTSLEQNADIKRIVRMFDVSHRLTLTQADVLTQYCDAGGYRCE